MKRKEYIAPELTVVSFKMERGFALSGFATMDLFHELEQEDLYNASNQENWYYEEDNNFFGSW